LFEELIQHPASGIRHSISGIISAMPPISRLFEYDLTEQRSRFHAAAVPAATLEDVKKELKRRKKKYRKARHHCWACRVRDDNGQIVEQARDDGEVGRPGMKMLELLRHHDLEGLLVVSRIFGGVKLGPGGVGRAFRDAAAGALDGLQ
jgi:putative IMPACT (imprinted ancient) family translation regulator